METEYRRASERYRHWRQQLRDALRPDPKPAPLSRRAVRADLALAVLLTVVALIVAARYPGDGPVRFSPKTEYADSNESRYGIGAGNGTGAETVPVSPQPPQPPQPPPSPPPVPRPPIVMGEGHVAPWPLVVLSALPLLARRRYPLAVFGVVLGAGLATGDGASWITVLTCVIGAYSAVVHSRYRAGALAALVVGAVLAGVLFQRAEPILPGWSSPGVVLLVAGVLAGLVRFWQRRLAAGRDRFARLQRTQEEAMRRAVAEERARIAAELHDVVTHNVSVMVIQAGAARKVMDAAPERSKQALLAVEAGGRAAMAELRHVMGLLAAPDTGPGLHDTPADSLEPQPGLDRLDALTERVRGAGTPVTVAVSLPPDPLPPGVDLTAYRVVQEALTNTIKHAPGAEASVLIGWTDDRLQIEVGNTSATAPDSPPPEGDSDGDSGTSSTSGRGLIGLRERLAVYGGELTAGPTLAGGYRITASVPWRTP